MLTVRAMTGGSTVARLCACQGPPAGRSKRVGVHEHGVVTTVAEAYLSVLKDRGVSRLFVNAGTDFAPIVEAYARQKQSGLDFPELVVCAHENLAISMAHGAYLGDGRVQAVMVRTSVGTANAVCGTFNAATDRIPILLAAGRSPLFEDSVLGSRDGTIHWGAGNVRPGVCGARIRQVGLRTARRRAGRRGPGPCHRHREDGAAGSGIPVAAKGGTGPRRLRCRASAAQRHAHRCLPECRRGRPARGPAGRRELPGLRHGGVGGRPWHGAPARTAV